MIKRHWWLISGFVGVALAIAGGGWVLLRSNTSIGNLVNASIDNLLATGGRLLELPLFILLLAGAAVGVMLGLGVQRFSGKPARQRWSIVLFTVILVVVNLAVVLVADRRIARLQQGYLDLRSKAASDTLSLLHAPATGPSRRETLFFDQGDVQKSLGERFGQVTLKAEVCDDATDIIRARVDNLPAQAFLAIIDLKNPAVQIKLGGRMNTKTLTSAYALENECTVAINGEAGMSPGPESGLGTWRGNLVCSGNIILREDSRNPKPFLAFDRQNHATFTPASSSSRALAPEPYNVVWGRWDALANGKVIAWADRTRQPRTAMAINQGGTRLYLLVVDGRQPGYSVGFTPAEVGYFLQAFGAHDGMLCDEGGSSCMYVKQLGGITNIPSDNHGLERPTYTHFGIAIGKAP